MAATGLSLLYSQALTHRLRDVTLLASLLVELAVALPVPVGQGSLWHTWGSTALVLHSPQHGPPHCSPRTGRQDQGGKGAGNEQGDSSLLAPCGHCSSIILSSSPLSLIPAQQ